MYARTFTTCVPTTPSTTVIVAMTPSPPCPTMNASSAVKPQPHYEIRDVNKTFSTTDAITMTASTDCRVLQQLLQKETELYEKTKKEHQLEKEKLQAELDTLVKAKLKNATTTIFRF